MVVARGSRREPCEAVNLRPSSAVPHHAAFIRPDEDQPFLSQVKGLTVCNIK